MILKNNLQEYCYGEQCYMAWGFWCNHFRNCSFPMFKVLSLNNLLYSEYSDATKRKLPNTRSVVIHVTAIYYGLILLCIFSYYLAGMPLFDAICHGMSSVSTGGFANYNDSIGHYNNPMLEVITIIFMILGSLPFLSYLKIIRRLDICYDEQVSYFVKIATISSLFACFGCIKMLI